MLEIREMSCVDKNCNELAQDYSSSGLSGMLNVWVLPWREVV